MSRKYKQLEANLWVRNDFEGISYTDGLEIEERLLNIISEAKNISILSEELESKISDWPTLYHLSRIRHCVLRPLEIKKGDKVLELGCGCGAITRFIGESGAQITAVEGSLNRARIASMRCRDLDNVKVVCEDLLLFSSDQKFDWVILVGVIEYAPLFSMSDDPVQDYLAMAASFLSSSGKIVVVIENQLGLKYFNGCCEDHSSEYFYGINDLYGKGSPVTFGRRELKKQIQAAGFSYIDFYYLYPDYKFPQVVVKDSAYKNDSFRVSELLMRMESVNHGHKTRHLFSDALSSGVLERNDLLRDFANSFLVVASKKDIKTTDTEKFAWIYSIGKKKQQYCTETFFSCSGTDIMVTKELLVPCRNIDSDNKPALPVSHKTGTSKYIKGRLVGWKIIKQCLTEEKNDLIAKCFSPWFCALKKEARLYDKKTEGHLYSWMLSGDMVDATPFNCIEVEDEFVFFDKEWHVKGEIPLGFVLFRSVLWMMKSCFYKTGGSIDITDIMTSICFGEGLVFNTEDIDLWQEMENSFQNTVLYDYGEKLTTILEKRVGTLIEMDQVAADIVVAKYQNSELLAVVKSRDDSIAHLELQLDKIYGSKSWRLTKPLRYLSGLCAGKLEK